jgi:hypothetical protein
MTRPIAESAGGAKPLQQVAMLALLEHDPRPTFILDGTDAIHRRSGSVLPVYHNPALADLHGGQFLALIRGKDLSTSTQGHHTLVKFQDWITIPEVSITSYTYRDYSWTKAVLAKKWAVIFGAPLNVPTRIATPQQHGTALTKRNSRSKTPTLDWTDELPPLRTMPHIAWARSIDWSQTPLGPMSTWSSQLRSHVLWPRPHHDLQ